MASRTKQKEEARARRLAEEQARAERARRQRRLQLVGGVVVAAIAVVAVAIAISSSGGGSGGIQSGSQRKQTVRAVQQLLAGIPQTGTRLGNPKAPVTMIYYGDLQCPICQDFTLRGGFPQIVQNDVRGGKVQVVYRDFETATKDPQTFQLQQAAALAAGKQNRFWDFVEVFYREQGTEGTNYVNESYLTTLATDAGLDLSKWRSDRNDSTLISQVQSDQQAGSASGVQGTPTVIMQGRRGKAQVPTAVPSYSDLEAAIKSVS